MVAFRLEPQASYALDDIYRYSRDRWGREQADRYIDGLFTHLGKIADRRVPWRRIATRLGVEGYFCRYEHHYIYWKEQPDGVGIFAILHESMDQDDRLRSR